MTMVSATVGIHLNTNIQHMSLLDPYVRIGQAKTPCLPVGLVKTELLTAVVSYTRKHENQIVIPGLCSEIKNSMYPY